MIVISPHPVQNWLLRAVRGRRLFVAAAVGVVAIGTVAVLMGTRPSGAQQQTTAAPPPPPVTVAKPLARDMQDSLIVSGQFAPVESVEVRARVNGYLTEVRFTDGQLVKKGDLLFVIDPRPYEDAVDIAKAQVAQAEAALDLAKRQQARGADLVKREFLAQSDYDTRNQQVAQSEAQLAGAKAQVRDAQLNLEFTRVTAPVAGRVGAHQVSVGNLISGGGNGAQATLLATVVSLDPIWFDFELSEADYLALARNLQGGRQPDGRIAGIPVAFQFDGESGWPHQGTLDFLDNQIDRSSGTILARATVPNADLAITPGQFAHVRVPVGAPHLTLLVPDAAVVTDQTLRFLMTVSEDGTVVPKRVLLGPESDGLREVRDGIGPDDRVVIAGLLRARAGQKVTPQPGTITPAAN